jgi:hypothetical protein
MNSNILNKTDEYYFHKIIETLSLRGFNPELIISYLLLELKENEIVYITLIDKWYLYDYETKKWNEYDFKITISKVCQLYETFKIKFINYIETKKDELTEKNYLRLKYFANKIADIIYNNELNKTVIYNKCKSLFTIV